MIREIRLYPRYQCFMRTVIEVQFSPWDKIYNFGLPEDGIAQKISDFKVDDYVIVETKLGIEMGKIAGIKEMEEKAIESFGELKPILRKATPDDLDKIIKKNEEKDSALDYCKEIIEKHGLPMKLVDVHFSFDGGRITFAFIADSRIDFRELVKDLTRHFQKSIRLQQLGIRDEARASGDIGACGRELCCRGFLKDLKSITSEYAEVQQVAHRGSDKLSGVCGRLRCCLAYEKEGYEEMVKNLPAIGSVIKAPQGKGEVIGWHTLKQTVDVRLEDGETVVEVAIK